VETLAARVRRSGPINELDAVGWAIRLAKRVEDLHRLGVAHGGISAECIVTADVPRSARGVLVDVRSSPTLSAYHSPERHAGRGVSLEDDTWAVAVTLYFMLTGTLPFGGESAEQVRERLATTAPPPLAVFDVGDDELQRVLDEFLARNPAERAARIELLREALVGWHPDPEIGALPRLEDVDDSMSEAPARFAPPGPTEAEQDEEDYAATVMRDFSDVQREVDAMIAEKRAQAAARAAPVAPAVAAAPAPMPRQRAATFVGGFHAPQVQGAAVPAGAPVQRAPVQLSPPDPPAQGIQPTPPVVPAGPGLRPPARPPARRAPPPPMRAPPPPMRAPLAPGPPGGVPPANAPPATPTASAPPAAPVASAPPAAPVASAPPAAPAAAPAAAATPAAAFDFGADEDEEGGATVVMPEAQDLSAAIEEALSHQRAKAPLPAAGAPAAPLPGSAASAAAPPGPALGPPPGWPAPPLGDATLLAPEGPFPPARGPAPPPVAMGAAPPAGAARAMAPAVAPAMPGSAIPVHPQAWPAPAPAVEDPGARRLRAWLIIASVVLVVLVVAVALLFLHQQGTIRLPI
jgi:hypothetical protein